MKIRMEQFERRVGPIEMLTIEPPPRIESGLMKAIVIGVIEGLGLSPEQLELPAPEEKKPCDS